MTNQSELQQALVPLAKKAGYHIETFDHSEHGYGKRTTVWTRPERDSDTADDARENFMGELPGANGTLEGECEVVLSWLAKAGYTVRYHQSKKNYIVALVRHQENVIAIRKFGPTLHEALASAVKALPREDATDG